MNHALLNKTLLATALGVLLAASPVPADAQRSNAERQARAQAQEQEAAPAEMFPNATRESPEGGVSPRLVNRVNRLNSMLEGPENAQAVIEEAQSLIGHRGANEYVRSFAYLQMADAYEELDDLDNAVASLEKVIEEGGFGNDYHYQIMLRLGQTLYLEDRTEEGMVWLNRFFEESQSDRPDHLALMGNLHYQGERYAEAVDYMTRAIDGHEAPPSSWYQILMVSYAELGQGERAVEIAENLVAQNPDDKAAAMNLASALQQVDDFQRAGEVLDAARQRGLFSEGQDYRYLASIYLNSDDREAEAAAVLQEGIDKGHLQGDHATYSMLGQAYYFSEQYPQAIQAWTSAAESAPNGETHFNIARVHYEEGNWQQALDFANQAIERGLPNPEAARTLISNVEIELRR